MTDEWGPWIEHDGNGCPVPVGTWVRVVEVDPCNRSIGERELEGFTRGDPDSSWVWGFNGCTDILRYRIRKPRGMTVLQKIVASPERELEEVE